jgi:HAD superfamily hydrolase (TIGR01509 family)
LQTIFFDLGWTLEDETPAQLDRAGRAATACQDCGRMISKEKLILLQEEGGRAGVPDVFKHALSRIGLKGEELKSVRQAAHWDTSLLQLYPDTFPTLEKLSRSHTLGLIANQSKPFSDRLKKYGIHAFFAVAICSCVAGYEKPDPRIFTMAAEKIGADPSRCWMVGDRIDNDIVPCKRLGWKTIRIRKGSHRFQEPRNEMEKADFTIDTLKELIDIFLE